MQRIIDGRRYNTETAEIICELPCNAYPGDFAWHETMLYRTPKGSYFLAGRGGPMTMWGEPACGGGRMGGAGISAVSKAEARQIAERVMDVSEYEAVFGAVEEA